MPIRKASLQHRDNRYGKSKNRSRRYAAASNNKASKGDRDVRVHSGAALADKTVTDVRAILTQRNGVHGNFTDNALYAQTLKEVVRPVLHDLHTPVMRESLDMILHKIARIMAGDPSYADHWVDIAGYAQLVVDRLGK